MDIRENLNNYISDKAVKQCEIATRAGMTPAKLCAVLKKRRMLEANELFDLCDALGTTPDELRSYGATQKQGPAA